MIFKLEKYNGTHRIVSLAFDQDAYDNLLKKDLDFIYVDDNSLKLYPEDVIISTDEKIIENYFNLYDETKPSAKEFIIYIAYRVTRDLSFALF